MSLKLMSYWPFLARRMMLRSTIHHRNRPRKQLWRRPQLEHRGSNWVRIFTPSRRMARRSLSKSYRQGNLSIPASVELTTYAGSAESALDFADFDRHEIRFAIGEASKTIFVPIVADALPERSEVFRIVLGNSLGEMILTERAAATVFIIDDDT